MIRPYILAAGIALAALPLAAAGPGPLVVTTRMLVEQRRAAADGTTRITLAPPTRVGPGDRVVMVLSYRNTGPQPLADVVLSDPLPRSIAYAGTHAGSPEPELSVDGHAFGPLAALRAPGAARPAARADVTAVRWRLSRPLAPGEAGERAVDATVR